MIKSNSDQRRAALTNWRPTPPKRSSKSAAASMAATETLNRSAAEATVALNRSAGALSNTITKSATAANETIGKTTTHRRRRSRKSAAVNETIGKAYGWPELLAKSAPAPTQSARRLLPPRTF